MKSAIDRNPALLVGAAGLRAALFPIPVITLFWKDEIGMSLADIMWLQAIFGATAVLFEFPSGYVADRLGYRRSLLTGALFWFMGWIAYALVLRRILLAHGLELKRGDYELVAVGATGQRLDSMKRGETFAAILNAPWDAEATAAGMKRFADHREVLPDYPGGVLAVAREWGESHRDTVVGYLKAWLDTLRWARDPINREQAIDLLVAEQKMSREQATARLTQLPQDGSFNLAGLQSALDLRVELGLNPPLGPVLTRYYSLDYYHAASQR